MATAHSSPLQTRLAILISSAVLILLWIFVWSADDGPGTKVPVNSINDSRSLRDDRLPLPPLSDNQTLCTADTFNDGTWVHEPLYLESDTPAAIDMWTGYQCAGSFPHKCYQRLHEGHEFQRSKTILDYRWEPAQCILAPFHARLLADHLAEHPLLFVGDSINQLQFESLACLLGRDLESPMGDTNMTGGHPDRWVSQWVHKKYVDKPGAVTMAYLRSDYLVRLDDFKIMEPMDEEGYQIGRGSNFPWAHVLPRFDYIILNTGPHWHPDLKWGPDRSRDELLASFTEAMGVVFDYLKKNVKSHQRVWIRSTPYGHARCSRFKSPDTVPRPPTGKEGEYEWDMLEKFDHVWKQWIIDENDDRFHFLNVSLSNLRGDAHSRPDSDCLHTCLPGPVDDWNKLLYSEMARISA